MFKIRSARVCLGVLGLVSLAPTASGTGHDTIHRDVCVIGGGSAGTYTAVRLQQMGKTVVLVEKEGLLGGQVDTYIDPASGKTIDYGVKVFNNVSVVTSYFASLDVQLKDFTSYVLNQTTIYADLATASDISAAKIPSAGGLTEGLLRYQTVLERYPYLENGFDLPYPVPDDLLMPWGEFLEKYDLSSISEAVYGLVGGPGNILAQPTLYVAKNYNSVQIQSVLGGSALTEANGENQALYDNALARLGNGINAFVHSTVTQVVRGTNGVQVNVVTPFGHKTIQASKLIIAIPPKLSVLEPFLDLSQRERSLFRQFNNSYLYASIVANSGIPVDASLANVDLAAPLGIPPGPNIFLTEPSGINGNHIVLYGSPWQLSDDEVRADIVSTLNRWKMASNQSVVASEKPQIVAFSNHSPYFLTVPVDSIRGGFYTEVDSLQGQCNTFYTGAAWETSDSTSIWNFTETRILPKIVASLE